MLKIILSSVLSQKLQLQYFGNAWTSPPVFNEQKYPSQLSNIRFSTQQKPCLKKPKTNKKITFLGEMSQFQPFTVTFVSGTGCSSDAAGVEQDRGSPRLSLRAGKGQHNDPQRAGGDLELPLSGRCLLQLSFLQCSFF